MTTKDVDDGLAQLGSCRTLADLAALATSASAAGLIEELERLADELRVRDLVRTESKVLALARELAIRAGRRALAKELEFQGRLAAARDERASSKAAVSVARAALRYEPVEGRSSRVLTLTTAAAVLVRHNETLAAIDLATAAWNRLDAELPAGGLQMTGIPGESRAVVHGIPSLDRLAFELPRQLTADAPASNAAKLLALQWRKLYELGWPDLAAVCLPHLAQTLVRLGQAECALEVLHNAEQLLSTMHEARAPEDSIAERWLAIKAAAAALASVGRLQEAERALRMYPGLGQPLQSNTRTVGAALDLAELLLRTDRFEFALPLLEELPTAHESSTVGAHANALAAVAYRMVGRTEEATAASGRAQETLEWPASGRATREAAEAFFKVKLLLAEASLIGGEAGIDQARAILWDAERLLERIDDVRLRAQFACLQGDLLAESGNFADALSRHTTAYELGIRPIEEVGWEPEWYMGARSFSTNPFTQPPTAADCAIARQKRGVGAALLVRIAQDKAALGSEDATAGLDTAINACVQSGQSSLLFAALTAKGALQRRPAIGLESPDALEQAVDVLEASRAQLRNVSMQVSRLGYTPDAVYATLIKDAMVRNDYEMAVRLAQRAKSRGLLEEMVSAGRALRSHVDTVTRDRIRQLRADLVRAMRVRTDAATAETVTRVHELEGQLASAYRRQLRPTLRGPRPAATPEQMAALATDGTVVLDYFCADDAVFLTPARDAARLPTQRLRAVHPAEIRALLLDLADECTQRAEPYSLEQLGNMLLGPVAEIIDGAERLLIIPHSIVHSVPFAALMLPSGQHLIECCEVMYAPSAAVALHGNRVSDSVEPGSSVALGIPAVTYLPLTQIGGVREEVQELATHVSNVRIIDDAIRSDLLDLSGELTVLHIAAHGEFDAYDPLLSRLYLADGPVYAYDLLSFAASPGVVVLSGCETGMVELRSGDELFGLVRPFLAAGAGSVVAGLWKVSDTATARLMAELYSNGAPTPVGTAAALRRAQLALLSEPSTRHAYFWAPWIAVGRSPIPANGPADAT